MMKDIRLEMTCPFCGADHHVDCREDQYNAYCNGELAQVAFDDLNATEREQIISHICPSCQEKIFGQGVDKPPQMWYYNNVRSGDAISEPQQSRNATYLTPPRGEMDDDGKAQVA